MICEKIDFRKLNEAMIEIYVNDPTIKLSREEIEWVVNVEVPRKFREFVSNNPVEKLLEEAKKG